MYVELFNDWDILSFKVSNKIIDDKLKSELVSYVIAERKLKNIIDINNIKSMNLEVMHPEELKELRETNALELVVTDLTHH